MDIINSLGVAGVAGITVIVFLLGMIVHASKLNNKWIPSICGVAGAVLGVAGLYVMPDFPATDIISAVAVGIASGLAATGFDQMVKKMTGKEEGKTEGFVGYVDEEVE